MFCTAIVISLKRSKVAGRIIIQSGDERSKTGRPESDGTIDCFPAGFRNIVRSSCSCILQPPQVLSRNRGDQTKEGVGKPLPSNRIQSEGGGGRQTGEGGKEKVHLELNFTV